MTSVQPVVFLDVDGVLAIAPVIRTLGPMTRDRHGRPYQPVKTSIGGHVLRAAPIACMNQLCADVGAVVVMSSSWRLRPHPREDLAAAGLNVRWHADWRTDADTGGRGAQVGRWLTDHDCPPHVLIDDWPSGLEEHAARLVLVNYRLGMAQEHVVSAAAVLATQCCSGLWRPSCGGLEGQSGSVTTP